VLYLSKTSLASRRLGPGQATLPDRVLRASVPGPSNLPARVPPAPYRGLLASRARSLASHRRADGARPHQCPAPLADRAGAALPPHREGHRRLLGHLGVGSASRLRLRGSGTETATARHSKGRLNVRLVRAVLYERHFHQRTTELKEP